MSKDRNQRVQDALNDKHLHRTLDRFARGYIEQRTAALAGVDFAAARTRLELVRRRSVQSLSRLQQQFTDRATAAGATVVTAADAAEARSLIVEFARKHGVRSIAKSKSLATEEIELNPDLERAGLTVTETDLGEWILQLAGQRPSHFGAPAIHLSREQVVEIFRRNLPPFTETDREGLVRLARRELRARMLSADMGLTGGNIAIADTGTIVLVTNEGNGRMVTTFPRIQAAIIGLDKLVSTMDDARQTLELLIPCATGQTLSSYITMVTGLRPGLDELLIVLLDNGRSELAADPELSSALTCIRCSSCLGVCPVYRQVGGHVFGGTYFAGLGAVLEQMIHGPGRYPDFEQLCLTCGRCREFCPVGLNLPDLIRVLRRRRAQQTRSLTGRLVSRAVGPTGQGPKRISTALRPAARLITSRDELVRLPGPTRLLGRSVLPSLSPLRLDRLLPVKSDVFGSKVVLFPGCLTALVYPRIGQAVGEVLAARGFNLEYDRRLGCCGAGLLNTGADDQLRTIARYQLKLLAASGARAVVTPCPSCTRMIRVEYPRLLAGDREWGELAQQIAAITDDFVTFCLDRDLGPAGPIPPLTATYHDSCHLRYEGELITGPRSLLAGIRGLTLLEQPPDAGCCGFAGTYALTQPRLSLAVLDTKISALAGTGADMVVVDCPGCLLQIRTGMAAAGLDGAVCHSAQVMRMALAPDC